MATWYTLLRYADVPFGFSPFHCCRFGVASRERVRPMIPLLILPLKIIINMNRKPKKPKKKK